MSCRVVLVYGIVTWVAVPNSTECTAMFGIALPISCLTTSSAHLGTRQSSRHPTRLCQAPSDCPTCNRFSYEDRGLLDSRSDLMRGQHPPHVQPLRRPRWQDDREAYADDVRAAVDLEGAHMGPEDVSSQTLNIVPNHSSKFNIPLSQNSKFNISLNRNFMLNVLPVVPDTGRLHPVSAPTLHAYNLQQVPEILILRSWLDCEL